MSKTPRRPNYDRKLSRRIVLADGRVLVTLQDAADLNAQEFSTVMAWGALETAIERLLAATSGTHVDIEAATRSTRTDAARDGRSSRIASLFMVSRRLRLSIPRRWPLRCGRRYRTISCKDEQPQRG